jgi:hypothetical protein
LTFFTHRLRPSLGPFEAPVRWWFKISVRQRGSVSPKERISSTSSFWHPAIALSKSAVASVRVVGEVDVAH